MATDWVRDYKSFLEADANGIVWRQVHIKCGQVAARITIQTIRNSNPQAQTELNEMRRQLQAHDKDCSCKLLEVNPIANQ
jgi:hypothetical protein